ncbi:MAG: class I SAM-dependent methyltransferase [Dyella sp.]|uniref:class I SAM-dependent methyltransferase n=1 Tax=Dyella sp. TaxID=1869338 RepID=UPI003F80190F
MDFKYTGTDILSSTESTLANYNTWIARQFADIYLNFEYKTVLDYGAGIGSIATLFRCRTGASPLTLEIDAHQRAILKQREFQCFSNTDQLPFNIDFIYTSNVLEHISDDIAVLRKLEAHLSPKGRIAIFVPAFKLIWTTLDDKVGHQRRYTKRMLRRHLEMSGYKIERMRYCDSVGFMLAVLFKLIGNKDGEPSARSLIIFDRILWPVSRCLDIFTHPFFGKNILAVAKKDM